MKRRLVLILPLVAALLCAARPPAPTPLEVSTPEPTTPSEAAAADYMAAYCLRWLAPVIVWNEHFPDLSVDLVLALMAQESGCDPSAVSSGGAVGLMQVVPQPWIAEREALFDPSRNIAVGMRILHLTLQSETHNPQHLMLRALAAYNCGWTALDSGSCRAPGGYAYAWRILYFWRPRVAAALQDYCDRDIDSPYGLFIQSWLGESGYCSAAATVAEEAE